MMNIYDFEINTLSGETLNLSTFKGKNLLLVNTASACGYTPQYADLQALQEQNIENLEIIGFPANNFGSQEPGSNVEIADFCQKNYGVTFTMAAKIDVKGKNQHPLYKFLADKTGKEPTWNFCKYLVKNDGDTIEFFPSAVNPGEIIEKLS